MKPIDEGTAVIISRPPRDLERFRDRLAVVTQVIPMGRTCRLRVSLVHRLGLHPIEDASFLVPRACVRLHRPDTQQLVRGERTRAPRFPTRPKLRLL